MKNFILIIFGLLMSTTVFSQVEEKIVEKGNTIEATFWVNGNCEMCKKRIEKALDLPGVKMADYTAESQTLFIAFNKKKIDLEAIHEAIAAAGHDTKKVSAPDSVYNKLHHCCMYDRNTEKD